MDLGLEGKTIDVVIVVNGKHWHYRGRVEHESPGLLTLYDFKDQTKVIFSKSNIVRLQEELQ